MGFNSCFRGSQGWIFFHRLFAQSALKIALFVQNRLFMKKNSIGTNSTKMFLKIFQVLSTKKMSAAGAEIFYIIFKFWKSILGGLASFGGGGGVQIGILQGGSLSQNLATRGGGSPPQPPPPALVG